MSSKIKKDLRKHTKPGILENDYINFPNTRDNPGNLFLTPHARKRCRERGVPFRDALLNKASAGAKIKGNTIVTVVPPMWLKKQAENKKKKNNEKKKNKKKKNKNNITNQENRVCFGFNERDVSLQDSLPNKVSPPNKKKNNKNKKKNKKKIKNKK